MTQNWADAVEIYSIFKARLTQKLNEFSRYVHPDTKLCFIIKLFNLWSRDQDLVRYRTTGRFTAPNRTFLLKIALQTKIRTILHHYFKITSNHTNAIKVDPTWSHSGGRSGFCHSVLKFISPFLERNKPLRQTQSILIVFWFKYHCFSEPKTNLAADN